LPASLAVVVTWSVGMFAPFFVWSTGGLATVPFALAMFLAFEMLLLRPGGPSGPRAGAAALAASLLRVEGIAWVIVIGAGALVAGMLERRRMAGPVLQMLAIAGAGFAVFLGWRYVTYESWVANTAAAKVGMSAALLERGFQYIAIHVLTFLTPLLLIPAWIAAFVRRPFRPLALPLVGVSFAVFAYAVVVGGDFMAMSRLLVPGVPFNALLLGWMLSRTSGVGRIGGDSAGVPAVSAVRTGATGPGDPGRGASGPPAVQERWPVVPLAVGVAIVGTGMLPVADIHLVPESVRQELNFRRHWNKYWTEIQYWNVMRTNADRWKRLGIFLRETTEPDVSIVTPGIGYIGYFSERYILDQAGLVDRDIARRPTEGVTAPGHDKLVPPDYFLKDRPDIVSPHVVQQGGEMERTLAELRETAARFLAEAGETYDVVSVPLEGANVPRRTVPDAETAVLANLLAPFKRFPGPDRPREFVVYLKRNG
ncbi:MAG: hypothetical protein HKN12_09510, partial [Gemmatimonadetes bacterium]|nr:hypothetical protein [Gemmatimonadota bacterium]